MISVIMPCYNRGYDLLRVLRAYDAQIGNEVFELIAVDDASSDDTYQVISSYRPRRFSLKVARMEKNSGPAAARNRALELAEYPIVLFVGDDIYPETDFILGHSQAHDRYPGEEEAILGRLAWPEDLPVNTLMAHIDGRGAQQFSYYYFQHDQVYDYRHFYTSNISLKRSQLVNEGKYFDTGFVYAAFEDAELSYRLARRGLTIRYQQQILAYHYHYHTIWSFSLRQYRSGLMADRIIQKHPELAGQLRGKLFPLRMARLLLDQANSRWKQSPRVDPAELEQFAMHLASAFEWREHPGLEAYYLGLLQYFFFKGIIAGTLKERKRLLRSIESAYARRILAPLVKNFWERLQASKEEFQDWPAEWAIPAL